MYNVTEAGEPLKRGNGWALYAPESFMSRPATDKYGKKKIGEVSWVTQWFTLDPWQRLEIFKLNHNVFQIVSQRSQIISGLDWKIIPSISVEDEIAEYLKICRDIWTQLSQNASEYDMWAYSKMKSYYKEIYQYLGPYGLAPDLSNFQACLKIWSKVMKQKSRYSCNQIEDWLSITKKFTMEEDGEFFPVNVQSFSEFRKQYVSDLLIHGMVAIQNPTFTFDGMWILPGGSIYPVVGLTAGEPEYYMQLMYGVNGFGKQEPRWFQPQDLSVSQYLPNSALIYGMKPLDAIVNQVMENFNFGAYMAEHANSEKPPEYLIFVVDNQPPDSGTSTNDFQQVDQVDIERTDDIINKKIKDKSVRVLRQTGNDVKLLNISKENTIPDHLSYGEYCRKVIAGVFGATPNEMGDMPGGLGAKAGAESQAELYNLQSIKPIATTLENQLTYEILSGRFGANEFGGRQIYHQFRFMGSETMSEKYAQAKLAKESGVFSNNEIREEILGKDPSSNPNDDQIQAVAPPQPQDIMNAIAKITGR